MGIGLVIVTKEIDGEEWSNSYAVIVNDEPYAPLAIADFPVIGVGQTYSADTTNPTNGAYIGEDYVLAAILGFERSIHYDITQFVRLDVNDGRKETQTFASIPLNFAGLRTLSGGASESIAPGTITLLVNKVPYGYSVRSGRSFYRAALLDTWVRFSGRGGVDWADAAQRNTLQGDIDIAFSGSSLDAFAGTGANVATQAIAIPHYFKADTATPGELESASVIAGFAVQRPTSRQMKRGRRSPQAAE